MTPKKPPVKKTPARTVDRRVKAGAARTPPPSTPKIPKAKPKVAK